MPSLPRPAPLGVTGADRQGGEGAVVGDEALAPAPQENAKALPSLSVCHGGAAMRLSERHQYQRLQAERVTGAPDGRPEGVLAALNV